MSIKQLRDYDFEPVFCFDCCEEIIGQPAGLLPNENFAPLCERCMTKRLPPIE